MSTLTLDELLQEFHELADWEERCDYLIDLGFELPSFPEAARTEQNRVHGCQSNVWLVTEVNTGERPSMAILADSDSIIVKGLIAVLLTVYSGKSPQEIVDLDIEKIFAQMGLERHLSTQRRNGLYSMVQRIRDLAKSAA